MSKKNQQKLLDKAAINIFLRSVPRLIELWKEKSSGITFDEFLLNEIEKAKEVK